jgi:hypothetical protein
LVVERLAVHEVIQKGVTREAGAAQVDELVYYTISKSASGSAEWAGGFPGYGHRPGWIWCDKDQRDEQVQLPLSEDGGKGIRSSRVVPMWVPARPEECLGGAWRML